MVMAVHFLGARTPPVSMMMRKFVTSSLTHHPLDTMALISQTLFSDAFFVNEKFCILIKISLKFVPEGPIDNNPALV